MTVPSRVWRGGARVAQLATLGWALAGCGGEAPTVFARIHEVTAAEVPERQLQATRATAVDGPEQALVIVSFDNERPCIMVEMAFCGVDDGAFELGTAELDCEQPAGPDGAGHGRVEISTGCANRPQEQPWVVVSGALRVVQAPDSARVSFEAAMSGEGSFEMIVDAHFELDDIQHVD